jgi:hypothetical protein
MDHAQNIMDPENNLEAAEAELAQAVSELERAKREVERAERRIADALAQARHPRQFEVTVVYNGVKKPFEVCRDELVRTLLNEAISKFGPLANPHLLGLFTKAGAELRDDESIEMAGVKPHEELLLRPSSVRGG